MPKTEIGSKFDNIAEPVIKALEKWITTMGDSLGDTLVDQMITVARYLLKQHDVRFFYYLEHLNKDTGIYIGAEISDELSMELLLRFDWKSYIAPHSEIAFV